MKTTLYTLIYILLFLSISKNGGSQVNVTDSSINMPLFKIGYGANLPQKDLKDRFGYMSGLNMNLEIKTKSQWIAGFKYDYLFGNKVKEIGMLSELITNSGGIINNSGEFGTYELLQRGMHFSVYGGRLFPIASPNLNSGIVVTAGAGLLVHKIIFNNINGDLIQLNGEFSKGYDRYTSGLSFSEYIGYRYMSNNRLLNFYGGIEFTQANTKIRRDYQVDYEINDPRYGSRKDYLFTLQVGWILPLYKRPPRDFYY